MRNIRFAPAHGRARSSKEMLATGGEFLVKNCKVEDVFMGRGVATINHAEDVLYFHYNGDVYGEYNPETDEYEGDEYNEFESADNWDYFKTELTETLVKLFPSLEKPCRPKWDGECNIILENRLALFALAEYCGCVSLSIAAKGDSPLAKCWISSIFDKLRKNLNTLPYATRIIKICTASNGESFFEKAG